MKDWLENIVTARRETLSQTKKVRTVQELEHVIGGVPPPVSFKNAIHQVGRISVIAEMKRKSPSAGDIRTPYDVKDIALAYKKGGAHALSVLAEPDFFGGRIDDVYAVSKSSALPVLRKDFIFDAYQVIEARAFGASAILLIADMIDAGLLKELVQVSQSVGLEPLVEVFTEVSIKPALDSGATVIGINTRNLRTLEMNPKRVKELRKFIPDDKIVVAESGIRTGDDIKGLMGHQVSAVLVGESLLKQKDLIKATRELVCAGEVSS